MKARLLVLVARAILYSFNLRQFAKSDLCFVHQGNSPLLYTAYYGNWSGFVALIPGSDINANGISTVSRSTLKICPNQSQFLHFRAFGRLKRRTTSLAVLS